jgi:hypothetical protein
MNIDNVRELQVDSGLRDHLEEIRANILKRYRSPWVRIDAAASYNFPHGLGDLPHVVSVLSASDSQGTGKVAASSATVTTTVTMVSVTNTGAARFFLVRAF